MKKPAYKSGAHKTVQESFQKNGVAKAMPFFILQII